MKKITAKEIMIPTIALFVICLVASVLLALTNHVTEKKIEENNIQTAMAGRTQVLSEVDGIAVASYGEEKTEEQSGLTYCEGLDENANVIGYIFTSAAKGYGGDVKVMIGYAADGTIVGFTVLDASNETPGLGQNSTKDSFKSRFVGKQGELTVDKNSNDGQNIQAITAATITSKAVVTAVNAATAALENIRGGVQNG